MLPPFSIQPTLETDTLELLPLQEGDFADLYAVAADPKIWEQHSQKDRWQQPAFTTFFKEAIRRKERSKL